jgi:hypothetical protein
VSCLAERLAGEGQADRRRRAVAKLQAHAVWANGDLPKHGLDGVAALLDGGLDPPGDLSGSGVAVTEAEVEFVAEVFEVVAEGLGVPARLVVLPGQLGDPSTSKAFAAGLSASKRAILATTASRRF